MLLTVAVEVQPGEDSKRSVASELKQVVRARKRCLLIFVDSLLLAAVVAA